MSRFLLVRGESPMHEFAFEQLRREAASAGRVVLEHVYNEYAGFTSDVMALYFNTVSALIVIVDDTEASKSLAESVAAESFLNKLPVFGLMGYRDSAVKATDGVWSKILDGALHWGYRLRRSLDAMGTYIAMGGLRYTRRGGVPRYEVRIDIRK